LGSVHVIVSDLFTCLLGVGTHVNWYAVGTLSNCSLWTIASREAGIWKYRTVVPVNIVAGWLTASLVTVRVNQRRRTINLALGDGSPSGQLDQRIYAEALLHKALQDVALAGRWIPIVGHHAIAGSFKTVIVKELLVINSLVAPSKGWMTVEKNGHISNLLKS